MHHIVKFKVFEPYFSGLKTLFCAKCIFDNQKLYKTNKIKEIYGVPLTFSPAAIDTIFTHFKDRGIDENYYDIVATGDLGELGHAIAKEQLEKMGLDLKEKYIDCGMEIFDRKSQDVHAGGSGCGCCATVFAGHLYNLLNTNKIDRLLLVATGALMSTTSAFQGQSIPGVAHAVAIERV